MSVLSILDKLQSHGIILDINDNGDLLVNGDRKLLNENFINEIKQSKPQIVEYLHQKKSFEKITRFADKTGHELLASFSQQRMWLFDQINGGSASYNVSEARRLTGALNIAALEPAFVTILERHESLRTCFTTDASGQPLQVIQDGSVFKLAITDVSHLPEAMREHQLAQIMATEQATAFDLSRDLMLRVQLVKMNLDENVLLITMHHIASDDWSWGIFIREFCTIYPAYANGKPNPLAPLAIQYSDYSHWQHRFSATAIFTKSLDYWTTQLENLPLVHNLPLDFPRPITQSFTGNTHKVVIAPHIANALQGLCQESGATLFMGLHAAFSVLLSRYSNETDIVIGMPIANREQPELVGLIGFFVNTLVLRSNLQHNPRFVELLAQSKQTLLDAYENQQVPFEQLLNRLQPERSTSHNPLFQILINLQNNEHGSQTLSGLTVSPMKPVVSLAKYDLTLNIINSAESLSLAWEYNTDLFSFHSIARMADNFASLLESLVENPQQNVFNAEMIGAGETQQLLMEWNNTAATYPDDKCIHELFEAQAEKNPHAIALVFENRQLTYAELNSRANQLAHYLVNERQVKPDTLVGICIERSLEMVIGILAILKAGGAYVPLDPEYPQARLAYMLGDANLHTVLTQCHLREIILLSDEQSVCLDDAALHTILARQPTTNIRLSSLNSRHLAYVIYTSGSTGNPKGSLLNHRGLCNLAFANVKEFAITPNSRILQFASISFDAAVWELSIALPHGATLVLMNSATAKSANAVSQLVAQAQITHALFPPVLLSLLDINQCHSIKTLIVGGDVCSLQQANEWSVNRRFFNAYGPSEATVCATIGRYFSAQPCLTIGKPLQNVQTYILNEQLALVPVGVPGELYIGGVGLSQGYLNRPELDTEKFIPNPFYDPTNKSSSQRLYKTGDLVRRLTDGNVEFAGRIDAQVKIRGFRIELGEIENLLGFHVAVKEAVVIAKARPGTDEKQLVAYVVTDAVNISDDGINARAQLIESLREHLSLQLPDYMVPAAWVVLEKLPQTPNGKVDRKALPEPDLQNEITYIAPRTSTEKILCEIWQEVLGIARVGINDDFFLLGGHSLSATRVVTRINHVFNLALPIKTLFSAPRIQQLAQALVQFDSTLAQPPLVKITRNQLLPLSFAQERLWLLDTIHGGSAAYNIVGTCKLSGNLNSDALDQAFTGILARHESLRTFFALDANGKPHQLIQTPAHFHVATEDLSIVEPIRREDLLAELIAAEARRVFNLNSDVMLRGRLYKITAHEYILLVTMHHIASDGWSMDIFIEELGSLYSTYVQGKPQALESLAIQYADYAYWQRHWLQGDTLDQQLAYWLKQLSDLPVVHNLPLDHPRPAVQSFAGRIYGSQIGAAASIKLKNLCQTQGVTLFMGLHAVFAVLLSRYSNETDIVIGSPLANREQAEVANLIGFFANTLVLRSDLSNNPAFTELLAQSKKILLDAFAHQQAPFEQIVEHLRPERSLSHNPLFQVMLVLQGDDLVKRTLPELVLSQLEQSISHTAKFDLTLYVKDTSAGFRLGWEYNTDLFEQGTIARMAAHFDNLLNAILSTPEQNVFDTEMICTAETQQLLVEWNNTAATYPDDKCIHELFEAQVEKNPHAIALVFENQQLTYAELNSRANQLAHYLVNERQVKPDTLVGICIERSLEMVIGILAILKAGGAYVPLDPEYPQARLAYMLGDANLHTVLTQCHLREIILLSDEQSVCLDDAALHTILARQPTTNIRLSNLNSRHLAYVIYTSGSTGNPKGVMIEHRALVNRIDWMNRQYGSVSHDRILQKTPFSFDVSVWEFVWPLTSGAALVLAKPQGHRDPVYLSALIRAQQITKLHFVPSMLGSMIALGDLSTCNSLRQIFCSGEALSQQHINEFKTLCPWAELHNLYGPTEAAIDVSYWDCASSSTTVPIGRPIQNIQLLVLNEQLKLVPKGVVGELHIGGVGLARAYLNRPDLTAEKFIPNPFYDNNKPQSSDRLYKTGDMVRWLDDGTLDDGTLNDGILEFLGRIDHQVKIRGHRIEIGEIEAALNKCAGIKACTIIALDDAAGDKALCAYVVSATPLDIVEIRRQLNSVLPEHMMPAHFVELEAIPLSINGKVDRHRLPRPNDQRLTGNNYVAPRTEDEVLLASIWQEVLGLDQVGVTDNFFHIGGNSIKVIQVISRLKEHVHIKLSMSDMYRNPVIRDLLSAAEAINNKFLVPLLQRANEDFAVICLPYAGGDANVFYNLAESVAKISHGVSVYGLHLPGNDFGKAEEKISWEKAIEGVLPEIAINCHKPIIIYGHCVGSLLAVELAQALVKRGHNLHALYTGGLIFNHPYLIKPFLKCRIADFWLKLKTIEASIRNLQLLGFPGNLAREQLLSFVDNFRADQLQALSSLRRLLNTSSTIRATPFYTIIGTTDPATLGYQSKTKHWSTFFNEVNVIELDSGSHYFVQTSPDAIAELIVKNIPDQV